MATPKEEIRRLLDKLPDDVSFEDVQYHIYVQQAVERGLDAAERDQVISQEEAERGCRSGSPSNLDRTRLVKRGSGS